MKAHILLILKTIQVIHTFVTCNDVKTLYQTSSCCSYPSNNILNTTNVNISDLDWKLSCASSYWANITVRQIQFDETMHPWLVDGGLFYLNEAVPKNHICHDYIAQQFIALQRTVRHWKIFNNRRRLQSWDGSMGE